MPDPGLYLIGRPLPGVRGDELHSLRGTALPQLAIVEQLLDRISDSHRIKGSQLDRPVRAQDRLGADSGELDAGQATGQHLLGHEGEVRQR